MINLKMTEIEGEKLRISILTAIKLLEMNNENFRPEYENLLQNLYRLEQQIPVKPVDHNTFFQIVEVKNLRLRRAKYYAAVPKKFHEVFGSEDPYVMNYEYATRPSISSQQMRSIRVKAFINTSPQKAIDQAIEHFNHFKLDLNRVSDWIVNYDDWIFLSLRFKKSLPPIFFD